MEVRRELRLDVCWNQVGREEQVQLVIERQRHPGVRGRFRVE